MRLIDAQFLATRFYGSRQMVRHLWRQGYKVGRRRVRRLMRLLGIEAVYRRSRTSDPHPGHRVYPYRLKVLEITRPNHVWRPGVRNHHIRNGRRLFSRSLGHDRRSRPEDRDATSLMRFVLSGNAPITVDANRLCEGLRRPGLCPHEQRLPCLCREIW
ncbi:MAG: IS3 family transposase [Alphaproteobacteria bacterium]|nr:IS3 family transposase [Alphaproteobacteria bacterium]